MEVEGEILVEAEGEKVCDDRAHNKRRHKKYRYRRQGYHKSEKENARRMEAKAFLSGITLDSRLQPSPDIQDTSRDAVSSPNPASGNMGHSLAEELSCLDVPNLQEMAANLFEQSPSKLTPSRSYDMGFENSPYNNSSFVSMGRSVSLLESASTPGYEQKKLGALGHSKSFGYTSDVLGGEVHYCKNFRKTPLEDNRVVLAISGAPFLIFSTLVYKKNEEFNLDRPLQRQRTRINSSSVLMDLDVELGTINEVSLAHLFIPVYQQLQDSDLAITLAQYSGHLSEFQASLLQKLGTSYNEVLDCPLPNPSGPSFPWAWFRDHHNTRDVLVHYHPLSMDNYEFFVGPNVSTLYKQSYRVSVIQYAKASEVKRGVNDHFSETFPHIRITLSKLRSMKKDMRNIAKERGVDLTALSYAYVYFEKLVLMGKVTKSNRKVVAGTYATLCCDKFLKIRPLLGVCLLLAAKFFIDMKKQELKDLIEEITDTFRLSSEELVSQELSVLTALHFSLLTPLNQVVHHYRTVSDNL